MALSIGDKLTLNIHDIAFGGEGVARVSVSRDESRESRARPVSLDVATLDTQPSTLDSFVVFVPFVLTGETVEVEVTEVKKNFARAKLLRVVKSSPERVKPQCRYFGACGGCQYQHVDYAAQLRLKHKQVADLFQRIGGFDPAVVAPVIPCPQPYGYRNRIMIRSQWNKPEQKLNIGFIRGDCGLVEDIEECKIAEPALNEQIKRVRAHPPPKGGIKVVLRIPPEDWDVPPDSFFQNNFFLLPALLEVARDFFAQAGTRHLVDAYCGVGFFALELAEAADSFAGIEYDKQAIKAARNNAAKRGRTNGEFLAGKTEELLAGVVGKFHARATTVIVDPPRKGCGKSTVELLRQIRPAQVIHVSCHPATMARDLNALCAGGVFELVKVAPVDMFPQTQHVECVANVRLNLRENHAMKIVSEDNQALPKG